MPSASLTQPDLDAWAKEHPAGTEVVYLGTGDNPIRAVVASEPWWLYGILPVVRLEGCVGSFPISQIRGIET